MKQKISEVDEDWLKLLERIGWLGKDAIEELFAIWYSYCRCEPRVCKTCQIAIDFEFI